MKETQESIGTWAIDTFGPPRDPAQVVGRALSEFAELVEVLRDDREGVEALEGVAGTLRRLGSNREIDLGDAAEEMADVLVVLFHAAHCYGFNLLEAVNRKMEVNRRRNWTPAGDGQGQHADG